MHAPYFHLRPPSLYNYLLTPWCRVLEKLTGLQLVKKFPAFHGTRRFITALTSVRHMSLSWASPIQSTYPHPTSWRSILILSTHLRLGLPSGLLPSGFPTKTLYIPLFSPIRATCPAHLILLHFITRTILGLQYFSKLSYKSTTFGKRYWHKMCVWIFSTIFLWNISHSKRTEQGNIINVQRSTCKLPAIIAIFLLNLKFLNRFSTITEIWYFMTMHPMGADVFHADGRSDMMNLRIDFRK